MDFPDDDFDFHQEWTHCAGHLAGMRYMFNDRVEILNVTDLGVAE